MNNDNSKNIAMIKNLILIFVILFCFFAFPDLLPLMSQAILPLFVGFIIAYVINILCSFYEDRVFKNAKKKPRALSVILSILTVVVVISLIINLVIPQFISCIKTFIQGAPDALEQALKNPMVNKLIGQDTTTQLTDIDWDSLLTQIGGFLLTGIGNMQSSGSSTVSIITAELFGIVFALYFLMGKEKLLGSIKRVSKHYLPEKHFDSISHFLSVLNTCSHKYVVAQCTEAVILGVLCALGMVVLRMPYAAMIGALVGLTSLVPIVGAFIGAVVGMFMVLTVSLPQAIGFLVFFIVLQQIEGNLIYPRVVGSSIGLPGVLVLAAVSVGGTLFGFVGMILFVPLCATIYALVKEDLEKSDSEKNSGNDSEEISADNS